MLSLVLLWSLEGISVCFKKAKGKEEWEPYLNPLDLLWKYIGNTIVNTSHFPWEEMELPTSDFLCFVSKIDRVFPEKS